MKNFVFLFSLMLFINTNAQLNFVYVDLSAKENKEKVFQILKDEFSNEGINNTLCFISNDRNPFIVRNFKELTSIEEDFFKKKPYLPELWSELDTMISIINFEKIASIKYLSGNNIDPNDHFLEFVFNFKLIFLSDSEKNIPITVYGSNKNLENGIISIKQKLKDKFKFYTNEI
jgi:hypothetical protein